MKTEIIYEDKELLVVRKPAGLATQTAGAGQADVVSELKNYLAEKGTGQPYLGIIHRLDQPVEGLLVFAKNKKAAASLTKQLGEQEGSGGLNKQYYAVFCGKPSEKSGTLVDYMYKAAEGRAAIVDNPAENTESWGEAGRIPKNTEIKGKNRGGSNNAAGVALPKKAVLDYQILQTITAPSGDEIFLAEIRIHTGRFHQIRAQMANAGMALLGDVKYGDEISKSCSQRLGIRTTALCACKIAFQHPVVGEGLSFEIRPGTRAFSFFNL